MTDPTAIHDLYARVGNLLDAGDFAAVDAILRDTSADEVETTFALSLLTATLAFRDDLPSRPAFFADVRVVVTERGTLREHPTLLDGLEGASPPRAADKGCAFCGKPQPPHSNYCSWACMIACARANGGVAYLPNGLPIGSIRADGMMFEHGHGDHPTYLFPVDVDGKNDSDEAAEGFAEYPQSHALVYTDGNVALTMYEANYALWSVRDGAPLGGRCQREHERLAEASREKIRALVEQREAQAERAAGDTATIAQAPGLHRPVPWRVELRDGSAHTVNVFYYDGPNASRCWFAEWGDDGRARSDESDYAAVRDLVASMGWNATRIVLPHADEARTALAQAAAKLDAVAAGERSLAEAEERDGDETHAAMRRQNAWAFAKAAELIRPKETP